VARDDSLDDAELTALAAEFGAVLGLGLADLTPADLDLAPSDARISVSEVETLVAERMEARARKDFATSDRLRQRLAGLGVTVDDQPGGTSSWRWTSAFSQC
jgi:cysteinyl-tRNA synthetase